MSGGGGGNSGMMMAMMMQQQQQAAAAQAVQQEAAQREQARQFDITQTSNATAAQQAAAQFAAQQQSQQQQYEASVAAQQANQASQQQMHKDDNDAAAAQQAAMYKAQQDAITQQQQYAAAQQSAADSKSASDLAGWNQRRGSLYSSSLQDALNQLTGMGDSDPNDAAAVQSAFGSANAGLADNQNLAGVFDGLGAKTFANLTAQKQSALSKTYNSLFPTDFATTKVADTTDDDILNSILQGQYDTAQQNAARLRDRGVITSEGYDSNIKGLTDQRSGALGKLTVLGNNELNSERSSLTNIANQGRTDISNFQLGQTIDPNSYLGKVNSAYDTWFSGLGDKLKGLAPSDLFDTSGFLNTAGAVQGPQNSPFVGTTNALTGADATAAPTDDSNDPTKKKSANALGSPATGVF